MKAPTAVQCLRVKPPYLQALLSARLFRLPLCSTKGGHSTGTQQT